MSSNGGDRAALSVALVGFGTVGRAVAGILCNGAHRRLRLTHVCNRGIGRKKVDWVPSDVTWRRTSTSCSARTPTSWWS